MQKDSASLVLGGKKQISEFGDHAFMQKDSPRGIPRREETNQ